MKYFIISGEASGDQHAARLMHALKERDGEALFAGLGGDAMREEGAKLYQDYREMAFMGIFAVLANMGKVRRNFRIAQEALKQERPDALILVDYPSFNLRMAEYCKKKLPNTKIYYYIPPKVWAWKSWRIHKIARLSNEVLGIFPFEPTYYATRGYHCHYTGNPTAEAIAESQKQDAASRKKYIAVLPGSRKSEIQHCLKKMLDAAEQAAPQHDIIVAAAPGQDVTLYTKLIGDRKKVRLASGDTYTILRHADAAIVNSGTATLEAALTGCPQVAVYHIAVPFAIYLAPLLFHKTYSREAKRSFFTLPNIILRKEVIKEFIGSRFTIKNVADEVRRLLNDEQYKEEQQKNYHQIAKALGDGKASENAAKTIAG